MRINTWHFTAVITCWTRLYLYDPTVFFFITCDYRNYVSFNLCLTCFFMSLRSSEISLFWNLQLFYWHFLEILWIFIFIVFYSFLFVFLSFSNSHVFLLFIVFIFIIFWSIILESWNPCLHSRNSSFFIFKISNKPFRRKSFGRWMFKTTFVGAHRRFPLPSPFNLSSLVLFLKSYGYLSLLCFIHFYLFFFHFLTHTYFFSSLSLFS